MFGRHAAALAEYVSGRQDDFVPKPASLTFEQAAAMPVAGFSALQALRDKAGLQPDQHVLINGAAGGVGTFAVQIAKAFGAEVTGVCGTANVALVESIGADHVIEYTREDFARRGLRYDVILDVAANRSLSDYRRVLAASGVVVLVGAGKGRWFGPMTRPLTAIVLGRVWRRRMLPLLAHPSRQDLTDLRDLVEAGKLTPVVDRVYPLTGTPDAMRYLETGHARGKVIIAV